MAVLNIWQYFMQAQISLTHTYIEIHGGMSFTHTYIWIFFPSIFQITHSFRHIVALRLKEKCNIDSVSYKLLRDEHRLCVVYCVAFLLHHLKILLCADSITVQNKKFCKVFHSQFLFCFLCIYTGKCVEVNIKSKKEKEKTKFGKMILLV